MEWNDHAFLRDAPSGLAVSVCRALGLEMLVLTPSTDDINIVGGL